MAETLQLGIAAFVFALVLCTAVVVACCVVSGRASRRGR